MDNPALKWAWDRTLYLLFIFIEISKIWWDLYVTLKIESGLLEFTYYVIDLFYYVIIR